MYCDTITTSETWNVFYCDRVVFLSMRGGWSWDSSWWDVNTNAQWLFKSQHYYLSFLIQERKKKTIELFAIFWAMCHLDPTLEGGSSICHWSTKAPPVQANCQSLQIQGTAWGRKGQMSTPDQGNLYLFWLLCTLWLRLLRMAVLHPWCLHLFSQVKAIVRCFQRACHKDQMQVVLGNGKPLSYYILQKAQGQ